MCLPIFPSLSPECRSVSRPFLQSSPPTRSFCNHSSSSFFSSSTYPSSRRALHFPPFRPLSRGDFSIRLAVGENAPAYTTGQRRIISQVPSVYCPEDNGLPCFFPRRGAARPDARAFERFPFRGDLKGGKGRRERDGAESEAVLRPSLAV